MKFISIAHFQHCVHNSIAEVVSCVCSSMVQILLELVVSVQFSPDHLDVPKALSGLVSVIGLKLYHIVLLECLVRHFILGN